MGILRLLLALGVVTEHAGRSFFTGSYTAVQIFFVISGFYMALILSSGRYESVRSFYASRFARLFPAYWIALLIGSAFAFTIYVLNGTVSSISELPGRLEELAKVSVPTTVWAIFSNIFLVSADYVWFIDGINVVKHPLQLLIQPPVWTLALELYFYALCPLLVRSKTTTLLLLMLISLIARVIGYSFGLNTNPYHARFFPFEVIYFLAGILSYRVYKSASLITVWLKGRGGMIFAAGYILCIVYFYDIVKLLPAPKLYGGFQDYFHSIAMCILAVPAMVALFHISKSSWTDRQLGELSYPIYIVHYAFVSTLLHTKMTLPFGLPVFWVILSLSLLTSVILHFAVQIPVDRFRIRRFAALEDIRSN